MRGFDALGRSPSHPIVNDKMVRIEANVELAVVLDASRVVEAESPTLKKAD